VIKLVHGDGFLTKVTPWQLSVFKKMPQLQIVQLKRQKFYYCHDSDSRIAKRSGLGAQIQVRPDRRLDRNNKLTCGLNIKTGVHKQTSGHKKQEMWERDQVMMVLTTKL
jgi:hypothetical protein